MSTQTDSDSCREETPHEKYMLALGVYVVVAYFWINFKVFAYPSWKRTTSLRKPLLEKLVKFVFQLLLGVWILVFLVVKHTFTQLTQRTYIAIDSPFGAPGA
jgi:hypothetical protein